MDQRAMLCQAAECLQDKGSCWGVASAGITGTPVVDPTNSVVYVVANSKPTTDRIFGGQSSSWTLYSLDLTTGLDKYKPMLIQVNVNNRFNISPLSLPFPLLPATDKGVSDGVSV